MMQGYEDANDVEHLKNDPLLRNVLGGDLAVYINPKVPHLLIEKYTTYNNPECHQKTFYKNDKYVYKTRDNITQSPRWVKPATNIGRIRHKPQDGFKVCSAI
jgi:hypothetical protein